MKVEQLMQRPVLSCSPGDSLNTPAQLMWDHDVGCVVVLEHDKVVGVITDRDICMGAYTRGGPLGSISVRDSMAKQPITVHPDASIESAEKVMQDKKVRRLPVVDASGKLIGLLSLNDVAREVVRQRGRKSTDVAPDMVISTFAALCEPRHETGLTSRS